MRPVRLLVPAAVLLAFALVPASAQPIVSAKSGVIAGVEGKVLIDQNEVQSSVTHFPEVKEGSVLSTEDGRVELMLPPGFMLRMGENASLKMVSTRLIDTRLEMLTGSAVVEVDQTSPDYSVSITLKNGVVNLSKIGVYRFDCDPARVKVFHGSATAQIADQNVMIGTGRMLALDGQATATDKFDPEQTDALDNWSRRRAEAMAVANVSGAKYNGANAPQKSGGTWGYNPYFDMYTYIPYYGRMCNPYYGICYYSPGAVYQYFVQRPSYAPPPGFGASSGGSPTYSPMSGTSSNTATSVTSMPSVSNTSSPAASSSSSSSAASSAASSGHGSAASGGHGK